MSRSEEIITLLDALDSHTHRFGPDHPQTLLVVHTLAAAVWRKGDVEGAIGLLNQALDRLNSSVGWDHPMRVPLLSTLGEVMFEQRELGKAGAIYRELLEHHVQHAGADDPAALAAKADLAAVLFELGCDEEAALLELEAFESASRHLGKSHSVTSVLAWNRALNYERCGDLDSARKLFADELIWLLAEDPSGLEFHQNIVPTMLAERFHRDYAPVC